VEVGDILRIGYIFQKIKREQYYEGVVIAKQNRGLGKSFYNSEEVYKDWS
jgi:ribosomal protein L19